MNIVVLLQEVFPRLGGLDWAVQWEDEEGDRVTVTTSTELRLALSTLATPQVRVSGNCMAVLSSGACRAARSTSTYPCWTAPGGSR